MPKPLERLGISRADWQGVEAVVSVKALKAKVEADARAEFIRKLRERRGRKPNIPLEFEMLERAYWVAVDQGDGDGWRKKNKRKTPYQPTVPHLVQCIRALGGQTNARYLAREIEERRAAGQWPPSRE